MTDVGTLVHRLRNTPVEKLVRALERAGFELARSTRAGSRIYRHPDGRLTVIHYHRGSETLTRRGVPPTVPTWGSMLAEGRSYLYRAPWLSIFPGLAIFITVLGINLLGDGLRDVLDPKLRGT